MTRQTRSFILKFLFSFLAVLLFLGGGINAAGKDAITIDYGTQVGRISPYIAGITDSPYYDEGSYALIKEGNFKLVEVMVWMSSPPVLPNEIMPPFFSGKSDDQVLRENVDLAKKQIRSIFEAGAEPLVLMISSNKPRDLKKYREQVSIAVEEMRTVAIRSGEDLRLFRFGNEPEMQFSWQGTRDDFFETYKAWAGVIKSISKDFIVQAPGLAAPTARYTDDRYFEKVNKYTSEFLSYCKINHVPLDIFSFHYYGPSIKNLVKIIRAVKNEIIKYPDLSPIFGVPKIGIDEWNILVFGLPGISAEIFDSSHTATHNVAAISSMVNNDVWLSIRFGGIGPLGGPPGPQGMDKKDDFRRMEMPPIPGGDFLMLKKDRTPKPVYYGFKAVNDMLATPVLLGTNTGGDSVVMAGKSENGRLINILISSYDENITESLSRMGQGRIQSSGTSSVQVKIKNFPSHIVTQKIEVARYMVDETHNLTKVDYRIIQKKDIGEDVSVNFESNEPSVSLIQIRIN